VIVLSWAAPKLRRTLNLGEYKSGALNLTTALLPAGATLPHLNEETGANQCSFSTDNNRLVKRGGPYIALPADLPQSSLYVSALSSSGFDGLRFVFQI